MTDQPGLFAPPPEYVPTAAELCEHCTDLRIQVGAARAALGSIVARTEGAEEWSDLGAIRDIASATLARIGGTEHD